MGFVSASCSVVSLPSVVCAATSSSTSRILPLLPVRWSAGRRRRHRSLLGLKLAEIMGRTRAMGMAAAVLSSSKGAAEKEASRLRPFLSVSSEEELLSCIRKEVEAGRLAPKLASGMEELYNNYRNAVLQSRTPLANEVILSNMSVCLDRIMLDNEDPYIFPPYHKAVREPFDYYMFGQNYIRPLIDFRRSYVGNISLFDEIEENLRKAHNVVFFSNHQTEADPAIISLLLERTHPLIAEKMICIAGDRVVTDPLCKPFSMGRNLICVYSKKHMYDIPELVDVKRRANTRSLKELALLLRNHSMHPQLTI